MLMVIRYGVKINMLKVKELRLDFACLCITRLTIYPYCKAVDVIVAERLIIKS